MKRKLLVVFGLTSLLIASVFITSSSSVRSKDGVFFEVPLRHLFFFSKPYLRVEIEGRRFDLLLDTGSSAMMTLSKRALNCIHNKQFTRDTKFLDVKGNIYPSKEFQIAKASLENLNVLKDFPARMQHKKQITEGRHIPQADFITRVFDFIDQFFHDGKIGFSAFKDVTCYFDYSRSILCVAESVPKLQEEAGYFLSNFIKVPFNLEKCGVVIPLETSMGMKKLLMDTGSSRSVLTLDEKEDKDDFVSLDLKLSDSESVAWEFQVFNISPFFEVDGILGSDFFKKHKICIDFPERMIYISL